MFHRRIPLDKVLLLLLLNFLSAFTLMYISLILSIRSNLTHLHDFQEIFLLPQFIEITLLGKSTIHSLFNGPEVLPSASDKAKLFAKNFSNNSNLDDSGFPF